MVKRAIIFANGEMSKWPVHYVLHPENDIIIAADGGGNLCHRWGVYPHVLIGDLDSISPALLARYEAKQINIIRHPSCKDESDLELALRHAHQYGVDQIDILGALGHRWDMTISNVMLLTARFLSKTRTRLLDGHETLLLLRERQTEVFYGKIGDGLSLIPLTTTKGVTINGFHYPLNCATLEAGTTQGISNIFTKPTAQVTIHSGFLLAIHSHRD